MTTADVKVLAKAIYRRLGKLYPNAACALNHESPLQLLIATILSAQCTDVRVNLITPALFARFRNAKEMAAARLSEVENLIRSTGFFRNKAKSIQALCKVLLEKYGGNVPDNLEELVKLPGVGRKTANVVLGNCFDVPGITVDTHVGRLSQRMGFTRQTDPVKIERDLMGIWAKKDWTLYSHRMIFHGRNVCTARNPDCSNCSLNDICPAIDAHPSRKK